MVHVLEEKTWETIAEKLINFSHVHGKFLRASQTQADPKG